MKDLNEYISELVSLENSLSEKIEAVVMKNESLLLTKLKMRLWNYGVDGSGNKIQPEYSPMTINIKRKNNQRASHVTLRDTGSFQAGMYVSYHNDEVNIFSTDYKEEMLTTKYGKAIMELTSLEQEWFMNSILDPAIQDILDKLDKDVQI